MLDLQQIVDWYGLDKDILAIILFPNLKHNSHALWRLIKGEQALTLQQAYDLAEFLGITIDDLFVITNWKQMSNLQSKDVDLITFKKRNFTIVLNTKSQITSIYHNEDVLLREKIIIGDYINIKAYLNTIDSIIDLLLTKKDKQHAGI